MEKGKLPVTEKLILESSEPQWRLLTNRLINELKTTALIELSPGKKIRVNLVLTNAWPPENITSDLICNSKINLGSVASKGTTRIAFFMNTLIFQNKWIFLGHIDGVNKVPIIIEYYTEVDIFIYTQKLVNEDEKDFLAISKQN